MNTPESWRVKGYPVESTFLNFLDQWRPFTINRPDNTPTHACALHRIHSAILLLDQRRNPRLPHQRLPQPQECMLLLSQSQTHQISQRRFAILSPSIMTITFAIKQEANQRCKCFFSISFFYTNSSLYIFIQASSQQPSTNGQTISIRRIWPCRRKTCHRKIP